MHEGACRCGSLVSFLILQTFDLYKEDNYTPPTFYADVHTQISYDVQWSSQHSTSCSQFYPSKSPLMATMIIVEVALLMAAALFGLYVMIIVILYFGILTASAVCESDNACGSLAVVKRKAREIAATSKCYTFVHSF